jgi:hypothetical protein
MLKRSLAYALTAAMAVAVALLPSHPAAGEPEPLDPPCGWVNADGTCHVDGDDGPKVNDPADPAQPNDPVGCPDAPDAQCSDGNGGWWHSGYQCYAKVAARGPDEIPTTVEIVTDEFLARLQALWAQHDGEGVIMSCLQLGALSRLFWWAPDDEPSDAEFEDAAKAAVIAHFSAPVLGVFPGGLRDPAYPEASGAVGLPVWLWADDPGPGVASTLVKNAKLRGNDIRIEVSLSKIVYDIGNGDTVTCGLGTEPVGVHKASQKSPTCGYSYMEAGAYTVTADTVFNIDWSAGGRGGVAPFTLTRSGVYDVGEIQVPIVSSGG